MVNGAVRWRQWASRDDCDRTTLPVRAQLCPMYLIRFLQRPTALVRFMADHYTRCALRI